MRNFGGQQSLKGDGYRGLAGLFCSLISLSRKILVPKSPFSRLISLKPFFSSVHSMIGMISK